MKKPSTVLLGLILERNFLFPNFLPPKYARESINALKPIKNISVVLGGRLMPIGSNKLTSDDAIKKSDVQKDIWIKKPEISQKILFCKIFLLWGNPNIRVPMIIQIKMAIDIKVNWKLIPKLI